MSADAKAGISSGRNFVRHFAEDGINGVMFRSRKLLEEQFQESYQG
jgi:hypothetical protein